MYRSVCQLILVGALTLFPLVGNAQVPPPPRGQGQRMELERRLHLGFQRSIQNQLGFDQERMQEVQAVMQSFQEERREVNRTQASLRYQLRDPALPDLTDAEARTLLQEMVEVQQRELDLYRREQEELLNLMTPVELLRFYRLRDGLGQRVQQLRQGRGQGGGSLQPPGGRGGGGRLFR